MKRELVISCEHGGHDVPQEYRELFRGHEELLKSHRGWDPGALELTKEIAKHFCLTPFTATITRLLVELNRSLNSKTLFSEIVDKGLNSKQKEAVIHNYYFPYRDKVEGHIKDTIGLKKPVLHLSVHTFTPVLNGEERTADIGLLYDPNHRYEAAFCRIWMSGLQKEYKDALRIKKNYPYKGTSDSLTTRLRSFYSEKDYMGIELEVNQKYPLFIRNEWPRVKKLVIDTLEKAMIEDPWT